MKQILSLIGAVFFLSFQTQAWAESVFCTVEDKVGSDWQISRRKNADIDPVTDTARIQFDHDQTRVEFVFSDLDATLLVGSKISRVLLWLDGQLEQELSATSKVSCGLNSNSVGPLVRKMVRKRGSPSFLESLVELVGLSTNSSNSDLSICMLIGRVQTSAEDALEVLWPYRKMLENTPEAFLALEQIRDSSGDLGTFCTGNAIDRDRLKLFSSKLQSFYRTVDVALK